MARKLPSTQPERSSPPERRPPRWADWLLKWFVAPHLLEYVQGDLQEVFYKRLQQVSPAKARREYGWAVLQCLTPFFYKRKPTTGVPYHRRFDQYPKPAMTDLLQNYAKTAWRSLVKDRFSTGLNLLGLSTGLACALFIYLWISDEIRVDKFHQQDSQLYQVMENQQNSQVIKTVEWTPAPLAESMLSELPEVQQAVTVMPAHFFPEAVLFVSPSKPVKAKPQFASASFFDVFSYKLLRGNKNQVLTDKNALVISEELAKRLFGSSQNSLGKVLNWQLLDWKGRGRIAGVFANTPSNSTQQFDLVLPFETFMDLLPRFKNNWQASSPSTYLLLKGTTNSNLFNQKIAGFVKTKNKDSNVTLFIRKYSDQYLYGTYQNGQQAGGRIGYVRLFATVALFILAIACINFMNLSTAKASKRLKEIGIKKAIGVSRNQLIYQYLGESIALSMLAMLMAITLVVVLLPIFNQITEKQIVLTPTLNQTLVFLTISFVTGLVAGSYPALYLSSFNPLSILRGQIKSSPGEVWIRKGLVIFQFTISIIMILGVFIVTDQLAFIQSKNLGYTTDHIIYFQPEAKAAENINDFISALKHIPGIVNASSTTHSLKGSYMTTSNLNWPGKKSGEEISFEDLEVNYDMVETLGMKLAKGRSFSPLFGSDHAKILLNETAVSAMGLKDPIGKVIELGDEKKEVIGVVRNFHFESLHQSVKPLFLVLNDQKARLIVVKLKVGNEQTTLANLQRFYKAYNPGYSLEYTFLNDEYQKLYVAEQKISVLSRYFTVLAIFITCLGLIGLTGFTAQKRQKEIGIRKVVGASTSSIAFLLSKDFLILVLIACLIAFPISWWAMNGWLQSFAYRTPIHPSLFLLAAAFILVITLLTISFQSIRAALLNPVKSLRSE
jgi:putative ABC transport system permease protein